MVNRMGNAIWMLMAMTMATATPAMADTAVRVRPGMMGVADIGDQACATFSEMHYNGPAGMELNVLTWVQGYVYARTGANIDAMLAAIPGPAAGADNGWNFDSLTAVFVDYCQAHPEAPVSEAAIALYSALAAEVSSAGQASAPGSHKPQLQVQ